MIKFAEGERERERLVLHKVAASGRQTSEREKTFQSAI